MRRNVALAYVRISRDDPQREKVSPDMQRDMCAALTEIQGLTVEMFDRDIGVSGKDTEHRPDYLRMMARLEAGDVKYVVAYDQSRITRSVADLQRFRDALAAHGVMFIEASMRRLTDPNDEDQELGSNILGSVDQHYRKKVARRVRDALGAKVARGELVGPVPAGYVRQKALSADGRVTYSIEVDPERAPIIRTVFRDYASGRYSMKSLARELNARRVPLPRHPRFHNNRPPAELWTADVLKDLLVNPRYVGRVPRRDGSEFPASYPALVDAATWDACQRIREQGRRVKLATAERRPSRYLLSGVLRCEKCGSSMSGWTRRPDKAHSRERRYYTCYLRRVARSCSQPAVAQDAIEDEIRLVLAAIALPSGFAEAVDAAMAAYTTGNAAGARRASAESVQARLERLRDLYELGDVTKNEYVRRRDELQRQLTDLRAEAEPVFVRQHTMLRTLVDDWEDMSIDERKRAIGLVFEAVAVGEQGIVGVSPFEEWRPYMKAVLREPRVLGARTSPVFRSE